MKATKLFSVALSVALSTVSGVCQIFPPVSPYSRLASWTQSVVDGIPAWCPNDSKGKETIRTAVYYQDDGGYLHEAIREGTNTWDLGHMPKVLAAQDSPLAVLHWIENVKDNVILLYFVRKSDNQLMEKRYDTYSGWWTERPLGATVKLYPVTYYSAAGGIAAVVQPGGYISIMYQSDDHVVRLCRYKWSSSAQCASEAESWGSAVNGTTISALVDASNNMHFFYQYISQDPVYDIREVFWNGQTWVDDFISTDGAYGAQVAVHPGIMPPGYPKYRGYQRHMLLSYYGRVDWMVYDPSQGCGTGAFCYGGPTGIHYINPPNLGLAMSGCTSNMRGYWVTPWQQIEEVSTDNLGWNVTNTNILRVG